MRNVSMAINYRFVWPVSVAIIMDSETKVSVPKIGQI